jgi:hypothetical protein
VVDRISALCCLAKTDFVICVANANFAFSIRVFDTDYRASERASNFFCT